MWLEPEPPFSSADWAATPNAGPPSWSAGPIAPEVNVEASLLLPRVVSMSSTEEPRRLGGKGSVRVWGVQKKCVPEPGITGLLMKILFQAKTEFMHWIRVVWQFHFYSLVSGIFCFSCLLLSWGQRNDAVHYHKCPTSISQTSVLRAYVCWDKWIHLAAIQPLTCWLLWSMVHLFWPALPNNDKFKGELGRENICVPSGKNSNMFISHHLP